jgi:enoyl-CoA hydratase/carnithine racemase
LNPQINLDLFFIGEIYYVNKMKNIIFEKKESIGYITLNNPKQRNALSLDLMNELQKQFNILQKNRKIKVIVIKGAGPSFCVGHDINELIDKNKGINHFRNVFSICTKMMQSIHNLPQPVIAQVHGAALAAGCQLVATCDLAIASKNAKFSTPGVKIGLFCSTPMVPLSRTIGRKRALDMLFTGRMISANEALDFGLINKIVEEDKLDRETEKLALEISKFSLHTLELGKKAFYRQENLDEKKAYEYAKEVIAQNCLSKDAQEGMIAFLEKRKAIWKDE